MATALKSTQPKPRSRRRQAAAQQRSHLQAVRSGARRPVAPPPRPALAVISPGSTHPQVRQLPTRSSAPLWLQLLIQLQRGSLIVAFVLVTAALVLYGSTMYMQQHWGKEYRKLKTMQRSERQMIEATAFMKNQLIQQAEQPGSGLVPRTSDHTIFLEPAPDRTSVPVAPVMAKPQSASTSDPTGY